MSAHIEIYGTILRIYDNGGKTLDRYTIIPPRWAKEYAEAIPGHWHAIGCNEAPFSSIGYTCSAVPGKHLGKRIAWDDLPLGAQKLARQHFPEYAPLAARADVTYHRNPTASEIRFGHGAVHYRDFPAEQCRKPGTAQLKKWIVAKDDGLRYYR